MDLKTTIQNDMKAAMKSQEAEKLSTLRMLISEIKKREIDTRAALTEGDICKAIQTMIKQRHESIEAFTKGGRPELADKEKREITVLQAYLPAQLSPTEVETLVVQAIAETGAAKPEDLGKVMKAALAKAQGRADGKLINEIVRRNLAPKG